MVSTFFVTANTIVPLPSLATTATTEKILPIAASQCNFVKPRGGLDQQLEVEEDLLGGDYVKLF